MIYVLRKATTFAIPPHIERVLLGPQLWMSVQLYWRVLITGCQKSLRCGCVVELGLGLFDEWGMTHHATKWSTGALVGEEVRLGRVRAVKWGDKS